MKICIVGAGAIGGLMGAKLALAGEEVTLIARGAHLDAIRQNGLKLIEEDGAEHMAKNVKATSKLSEAGKQDVVILALKAHQVEPIATELPALFGPEHHRGHDPERHPVVVLPEARRRIRGPARRDRGPEWHAHGQRRGRTHPRLRGIPRGRNRRAGRHQAHRGQPLPGGRTRRFRKRARQGDHGAVHQGRIQVAGAEETSARKSGSNSGET